MEKNPCDIYGCLREKKKDAVVTAIIDGETVWLKVCQVHLDFFTISKPAHYSIGRTYTQEVEVREHPAAPVTPPAV